MSIAAHPDTFNKAGCHIGEDVCNIRRIPKTTALRLFYLMRGVHKNSAFKTVCGVKSL